MKPIYFVDFDYTISRRDVWDSIVRMSAEHEYRNVIDEYLSGAITSRICNQRFAALIRANEPDVREMVLSIGLDPTFREFVAWLERNELEMMILSDGYDYYIKLLLESENLGHLPYFCNTMIWKENGIDVEFPLRKPDCEQDMAHCKCQHIHPHEGSPRVYIGDGISDICAAKRCERIYAKRNLLDYCRKDGIGHVPFEDFLDVIGHEERLMTPDQFPVETGVDRS